MRRLHILVEGQTEESVVRTVLQPHLEHHGWSVTYSILVTKRAAGGAQCGGPERIDDGPHTAPSKRITARLPSYARTVDGPIAIAALGLPALRQQCPHLDAWLMRLEGS